MTETNYLIAILGALSAKIMSIFRCNCNSPKVKLEGFLLDMLITLLHRKRYSTYPQTRICTYLEKDLCKTKLLTMQPFVYVSEDKE